MLTLVRASEHVVLIYANGVPQGLSLNPDFNYWENPISCANNMIIGDYDGGGFNLDGDIGVVRVYSTNLDTNQIMQLYTNGTNGLVR